MIDVIQAAGELQAVCQEQGWRFCFIGGVALLRWGQPRITADADLTLLTGFGGEEPFVRKLLKHFSGRLADAAQFAIERRVLLLRSTAGVGLDVALAGLPFEERIIDRATEFVYPSGISLRTCTAEDLIVLKSFAGRAQDWVDVENVILRQGGQLDWSYIEEQLAPLAELKEEPEIIEQLLRHRRKIEGA